VDKVFKQRLRSMRAEADRALQCRITAICRAAGPTSPAVFCFTFEKVAANAAVLTKAAPPQRKARRSTQFAKASLFEDTSLVALALLGSRD
jgi:hypothetical protein